VTARLLGPADAHLWRALWAEALAEVPEAFARRSGDAPRTAAVAVAGIRAFVWERATPEGAEAVACALWVRDRDPGRPRRGWVEAVFVRRHVRGQGIVARLIGVLAADARAHGMAELWLEVRADNAAARAAYGRAGFAPAPCPAGRAGEIALSLSLAG
jgi:ribosomal protein S18 acetylase RimI-like enzyme